MIFIFNLSFLFLFNYKNYIRKMEQSKTGVNFQNIQEDKTRKSPLLQQHPHLKNQSLQIYEEVLSYSGLKLLQQIAHRNVKIYQNQYIHQIFNIHSKESRAPHLVFLHGYGGTSMTAIKLFKPLHKNFQIHALDCYGMGYSSRGNFNQKFTPDETKHYYVDAIEEWRKSLGLNSFILVGHSFGGYLATLYSEKYPEKIERLILLSPAGYSKKFREEPDPDQTTFRQKFFYCFAQKIYNMNIRPTSAINNCIVGNKILDSIVSNRLKLQNDEKQAWKRYFKQFSSQKHSSEVGFYHLFDWPLQPVESIQEIINRNKFEFKIDFFYGDSDWMSRNGLEKLLKKYRNISLTIIPNAGHQLVFDNPQAVSQRILEIIR